jgi:Na+-translocating ferredoxin:NAD+ oxidoreductase RnfG subunit
MLTLPQGSTKKKGNMSSLAATQGIAFSEQEIRSALESVAIPGFTGSIQLEVLIAPEAAQYITIAVIRRQASPAAEGPQDLARGAVRQVLPDPTRKKPVESVIEAIKSKLRIRTGLTALEVHVNDGVLGKKIIQD